MRIKITFTNLNDETYLPINTNYYLVKLINQLTFEYRRYLNSLLSKNKNSNIFDMYTFSQLIIPDRKIVNFEIGVLSPEFHWYVSSPYYQFLGLITRELHQRKTVRIANRSFGVKNVSFLSSPTFGDTTERFTCLSPVAVYRSQNNDRSPAAFHLRGGYVLPDESEYLKFIKRDLIEKYNTIKNEEIDNLDFDLQYDPAYIRKRNNRITKIITLENGEPVPEQVCGVLAPLQIKASPDILQIIYDAGLGQLNNFGFGMVEKIQAGRQFH